MFNILSQTIDRIAIKIILTSTVNMVISFHRSELLKDFIQRYGILDEEARYRVLLKWGGEEQSRKTIWYVANLYNATEEYFREFLERTFEREFPSNDDNTTDDQNFDDLCRYVASEIAEEDWMRFARLYLDFKEDELQQFRGEHCKVSLEEWNSFVQQIRELERDLMNN